MLKQALLCGLLGLGLTACVPADKDKAAKPYETAA